MQCITICQNNASCNEYYTQKTVLPVIYTMSESPSYNVQKYAKTVLPVIVGLGDIFPNRNYAVIEDISVQTLLRKII